MKFLRNIAFMLSMTLGFGPSLTGMTWHEAVKTNNIAAARKLLAQRVNPNLQDSYGSTPLNKAVAADNIKMAELLLEAEADPNLTGSSSMFPLHHAVKRSNLAMAKLLLSANANPSLRDDGNTTPLHCVAGHRAGNNNDIEIAKLLLHAGGDLNIEDILGFTPLRWAGISENTEMANLLRNAPSNLDIRSHFGSAPLDKAEEKNDPVAPKLLIGSDVHLSLKLAVENNDVKAAMKCLSEYDKNGLGDSLRGQYGYDLLSQAVERNYFDMVKLLLEYGVPLSTQDAPIGFLLSKAERNDYFDIVELLLDHSGVPLATQGAFRVRLLFRSAVKNNDVKAAMECLSEYDTNGLGDSLRGKYGYALLSQAVESNYLDMVKLLLEHGIPLNTHDAPSDLLSKAARKNDFDIVKLLLEHGVPLTTQDASVIRLLFKMAVKNNDVEKVKIFLSVFGNNCLGDFLRGKYGYALLSKAEEQKNFRMVQLLREHGAPQNGDELNLLLGSAGRQLILAVKSNDVQVVTQYLSKSEINGLGGFLRGNQGSTLLSKAEELNNPKIIKLLREHVVPPVLQHPSVVRSLFKSAAEHNSVDEAMEYLSEYEMHGLGDSLRSQYGCNLLSKAVKNNYVGIVELLLEYGVPLDARDDSDDLFLFSTSGGFLLFEAAEKNYVEIVSLLLEHGVSPNVKDRFGRTALHTAAIKGRTEAVERLLEGGADLYIGKKEIEFHPLWTLFDNTPFQFAMLGGYIETVQAIIKYVTDHSDSPEIINDFAIYCSKINNSVIRETCYNETSKVCKIRRENGEVEAVEVNTVCRGIKKMLEEARDEIAKNSKNMVKR